MDSKCSSNSISKRRPQGRWVEVVALLVEGPTQDVRGSEPRERKEGEKQARV